MFFRACARMILLSIQFEVREFEILNIDFYKHNFSLFSIQRGFKLFAFACLSLYCIFGGLRLE